jgi:predicted nucleic acid-binding protein
LRTSQVVVDASFLLKLFLPEASSDLVEKHWKEWIENSVEVIAPTLIIFEASSVLRNKVFRGTLANVDASELIDKMRHIDLSLIYEPELLDLAWEIGTLLKVPTLYDCFYLAVAKLLNVPFWTADKRLYKSVKKEFPLINAI